MLSVARRWEILTVANLPLPGGPLGDQHQNLVDALGLSPGAGTVTLTNPLLTYRPVPAADAWMIRLTL